MKRITRLSTYSLLKGLLIDEKKTLLIDKRGCYSQKESFDILNGIINELFSFGVRKKDVVILSAVSRKEVALLIMAIISLGAIVFLKDPNTSMEDFLSNLEIDIKYKAHILFIDGKWIVSNKKHSLSLSRQEINVKPRLKNRKDVPSVYLTTSGSTGKNKIVALSEYSFLNHVLRQDHAAGTNNGCGYLCLPLYHMFGLEMLTIYLTTGALYISDSRNPEIAIDIMNKYQCTSICNVPTFYFMLIDALRKKKVKMPSLKYGVIAGGAYSQEQFLNIEKELDVYLLSTYGMTEACTTITDTYGIKDPVLKSSGVGRPFPGINVVLKDENNHINKTNGEVCFNGYNLMLGYLKKDGLLLPLDEDGFFHTGDIASKDEKGIYHIIGRKKDIIIRGGENLSPALIEQKIMNLDEIKDACVVGVNDQKYGEVVGVYLVSDIDINEKDILLKMSKILSKSELPAHIIIAKNMPSLDSGKPDKKKVKELLLRKIEQ